MNNQLGNQPREQWGSRLGFILAAMGSAVGLGNIWRFSYVTGENGGAAFLIIYFLCIILIGIPILMAEFTIGRRAQSDVVGSFQTLAPRKPWVIGGFIGVASAFIILSFYGVIAGWTLFYFTNYLTGTLWSAPSEGYGAYFDTFITHPTYPIIWQFIFMGLTIAVVLIGVKNGIEKTNKILMPILAVLLIVLAGYSLTLGGAKEGLLFLFSPDWSAFKNPEVYLAGLGQAFFSLSLGMGALITYGSYLSKEEKLPGAAYSVASLDTLFAVIAGIMIFPAVFAFGIEPGYGAGLAFVTLPDIFDSIALGGLVGLAFFFLLVAAGLSSAVSLLEVAVAYFIRRFSWSRRFATIVIGSIIFLLGIPSSLGLGAWSHITIFNKSILDSMDFLASNIFLPIGGLIIALFVGWGWNKSEAMKESDFGDTFIGHLWIFILRFIAPIAIVLIFLSAIGLF
ncbi:sodium-dependent transporter [Alkalihalobacillus sp. BA299]|uniref:sodium-dependent transporter n=1 Tax=Alkalihalobacillus sp. BA299 TaxID=2815938 RepID=UPI002468BD5E|nr:sodium-dependent transporter [Alkalihalobacillus sp. BA299]